MALLVVPGAVVAQGSGGGVGSPSVDVERQPGLLRGWLNPIEVGEDTELRPIVLRPSTDTGGGGDA